MHSARRPAEKFSPAKLQQQRRKQPGRAGSERLRSAHASADSRTVAAAASRAPATDSAAEPAAAGHQPLLDLLGFTLILDDIVSPTGESSMGRLGGGGPQTLWGFQLQRAQSARVALAAGVGPDLPPDCLAGLERCGIETGALLVDSGEGCRTPRAWQILEDDGRRHEIWRTPFTPQLVRMLRPPLADLPAGFRSARAFHVGVHPEDPSLDLLEELRAAADACGGLVSAETFAACAGGAVSAANLAAFMRPLDVFSPNEAEASSMLFGPGSHSSGSPAGAAGAAAGAQQQDIRRLTEPFLEAGAGLVALRRGPAGAVVHEAASGEAWSVPAFPGTQVVDPTGCGNAFCGALLAALLAGEPPVSAAAWGCAAGSLMAECSGTPQLAPAELAEEAARRHAVVLSLAEAA